MEFLAWPAVALILGLVCIFTFRRPLERLLDRTKKIGKGGLEAGSTPQESGVQVKPSPADEFLKIFDNALLVQRENFIRAELEKFGAVQHAEREKILLRLLAAMSIVQAFERAYTLIWGSQIAALQFLNSAGVDGMEADLVEPWYEQAAAATPELYHGYSFAQWLGFLEAHLLIMRKDQRVLITLEGREFLKYLLHQGYSLYKAG